MEWLKANWIPLLAGVSTALVALDQIIGRVDSKWARTTNKVFAAVLGLLGFVSGSVNKDLPGSKKLPLTPQPKPEA